MSFDVCAEKCNQCLFSENKIVSDKRRQSLLNEIVKEQSYFECHKATIAGKNTCCRGFYDSLGHRSQMIRIAERFGAIKFVEVNEDE
jgi:hypothetical protein